jgi:hypothetical protein
MYIKCLVERSDDTDSLVDFEQVRYRFSKNKAGHRVCFVGSEAHQNRLIKGGGFIPYDNPLKLEAQEQGNVPEPMTKAILKKKKQPETYDQEGKMADSPAPTPAMVDVDWNLDKKVAKVKEFKFLKAEPFKEFIEENRGQVMKWPIDVRKEIAKKLEKLLPEEDPGIEGFNIDDYIRGGTPGDT